jgi:hypothetical protein
MVNPVLPPEAISRIVDYLPEGGRWRLSQCCSLFYQLVADCVRREKIAQLLPLAHQLEILAQPPPKDEQAFASIHKEVLETLFVKTTSYPSFLKHPLASARMKGFKDEEAVKRSGLLEHIDKALRNIQHLPKASLIISVWVISQMFRHDLVRSETTPRFANSIGSWAKIHSHQKFYFQVLDLVPNPVHRVYLIFHLLKTIDDIHKHSHQDIFHACGKEKTFHFTAMIWDQPPDIDFIMRLIQKLSKELEKNGESWEYAPLQLKEFYQSRPNVNPPLSYSPRLFFCESIQVIIDTLYLTHCNQKRFDENLIAQLYTEPQPSGLETAFEKVLNAFEQPDRSRWMEIAVCLAKLKINGCSPSCTALINRLVILGKEEKTIAMQKWLFATLRRFVTTRPKNQTLKATLMTMISTDQDGSSSSDQQPDRTLAPSKNREPAPPVLT